MTTQRGQPMLLGQRIRRWAVEAGCHAICLPVAFSCLFPLLWMISSSLKTQTTVFSDFSPIPVPAHVENYVLAWTKGRFGIYFLNSLFYTATIVLGVLALSSLAAYAFSRFRFRGSDVLHKLLLSTMLVPVPGAFVALYLLLTQLRLIDQGTGQVLPRLGYILPQMNAAVPFGIFILKPFFDAVPKELEESAKVDGCGPLAVFWHIMLPLAGPALAVVALTTTLAAWNEFLLGYLVFSRHELMPLQRGLLAFHGAHLTDYPLLMAGMVITVVPVVLIYLVMQRHIIQGITAGALKG
ncbi:MAG: carbohydrate ABC transporter permease [Candidatus Omnitrophica bacterium]|nr:carbohydrate ABC transporter permease [Candidatus Omnitrophota bacterium]